MHRGRQAGPRARPREASGNVHGARRETSPRGGSKVAGYTRDWPRARETIAPRAAMHPCCANTHTPPSAYEGNADASNRARPPPQSARPASDPSQAKGPVYSTFLRKLHPSVSRALPPVGWQSTVEQPLQMTTVCAWLNTVVLQSEEGEGSSQVRGWHR